MEDQVKTLKEYLDDIGIGKGNDSSFVIIIGNTEMRVSRRYLESEPMKYFLNKKVIKAWGRYNSDNNKIVFELEDSDT